MEASTSTNILQRDASVDVAARDEPLPLVTDEIKASCGRFRVLVLGREGVGKSSLINRIFKINLANVAHYSAGDADITHEFFSDENTFLVLHDSQGYGTGELKNIQKLKNFINERSSSNQKVGERLHAIWLCIATPFAGSRVLQSGDEEIFRFASGKVPIIVVFTQYDQLVRTKERQISMMDQNASEQVIRARAKAAAKKTFLEECITPLNKASKSQVPYVYISVRTDYEDTLKFLVTTTLQYINPTDYKLPAGSDPLPSRSNMFRNPFRSSRKPPTMQTITTADQEVANSVSVMFATAQRIDIEANIKASVNVGRKKYWRGLASGAHFMGKNLKRCLEVIHADIVTVWNFPGIGNELIYGDFKGKVSKIVDELADNTGSPNQAIIQTTTSVAGAVGATAAVIAGTANPAGFIVGPIIAAVVFAKWVYDVYTATPSILRCFMAYIVDLIVIMEMIFALSEKRENGVVTTEEVEDILKRFETDQRRRKIHTEVRRFVEETSTYKAFTARDTVFEKIVELIDTHRYIPPQDNGDRTT